MARVVLAGCFHEARWRGRPRMLSELRLTYEDGTVATIGTDGSWRTTVGSYIYNNMYSGDRYDARLEEAGWKTEGFEDGHWEPAVRTEAPAPVLTAQQMPGIRITEELKPVAWRKLGSGRYVYSLAKNMAGVCRLRAKGPAGTRITVKYGELLKADGRLEQGNIDVYYYPVKEGEAFQTDVFVLKGTGEYVFTCSRVAGRYRFN